MQDAFPPSHYCFVSLATKKTGVLKMWTGQKCASNMFYFSFYWHEGRGYKLYTILFTSIYLLMCSVHLLVFLKNLQPER